MLCKTACEQTVKFGTFFSQLRTILAWTDAINQGVAFQPFELDKKN